MKRAVRMLFLMVGMVCAISALAAPVVPAPEEGAPVPCCTGAKLPIRAVVVVDELPLSGSRIQ